MSIFKRETPEELKETLNKPVEAIPELHKFQITGECDDVDIQEIDAFVRTLHRMKIEVKYVSGKKSTFDQIDNRMEELISEFQRLNNRIKFLDDNVRIALFGADIKLLKQPESSSPQELPY